jgi:hypothetical protein
MSERVGLLFANSGQYDDFRARSVRGLRICGCGEGRGRLNLGSRNDYERVPSLALWDEPDEEFESTDRKMNRIIAKLRRQASDPDIESSDIGDLHYTVDEMRLVR